ncbi:MAG: hypothetical protein JO032_01290 [Alphaproteobacteria bacterium]|nr:hypothetical protein [Alphaproteobacteria bacterium]
MVGRTFATPWLALAAAAAVTADPFSAQAYTASGDRTFPATLILPQLTPGDEAYINLNTLPLASGGPGTPSRSTSVTATWGKTITDRLGVYLEETYSQIGLSGAGTARGWQNLDGDLKYLAVNNLDHEFVMSLGLDRETGGTGARRVGASGSGATKPELYLGKGLGDLDIGYLRPLAVTSYTSVQIADSAPRPDLIENGFVVEYSIPYLQSKVRSFDLPDVLRRVTPMTEIALVSPAGRSYGSRTTALVAPGLSYAGDGWELAVEAQLPATRATGTGIGVTAQLHVALDFFFPDSIGKPLFASP